MIKSNMLKIQKKIIFKVITGSDSRFCTIKEKFFKNIIYTSKTIQYINSSSMEKTIGKIKPKILIHCRFITPMAIHETNIIER